MGWAVLEQVGAWERAGAAGALVVGCAGETIVDAAFGVADPELGRIVTTETGFDIGSLVKPFTAAAVIALADDGTVSLDDRLGTFFETAPADKRGVSLRQLLAHTSGLADIVDRDGRELEYTPEVDYEPVQRDEMAERVFRAPLRFAPGAQFAYSNAGYTLLAIVVELVTGTAYERHVRERLLEPAGMMRTGYVTPGWTRDGLAVGMVRGRPWGTPLDRPWLADGPSWILRGAGGMLSTSRDLHRWLGALRGGVVLAGRARETFLELDLRTSRRGTRVLAPAGSNEVFSGALLWDLDEQVEVALLTSVAEFPAHTLLPELARTLVGS